MLGDPFSAEILADLRAGRMVVVMDDEDRENEGDLVMAAEAATPENIAFFLAHTSGVICVPLLPERADALELPLMVTANTEAQRTAFTVSVALALIPGATVTLRGSGFDRSLHHGTHRARVRDIERR